MSGNDGSTLARIHAAAQAEFLAKGYQGASLRGIAKDAGVTTGALYGYYESKEALFAALVEPHYRYFMDRYHEVLFDFESLPPERQREHLGSVGKEGMEELLLYMNAHREAFHLILRCAEGTPYAAMVDELVEQEVEATEHYRQALRSMGHTVPAIDPRLEHILVTGMMNAYFEILLHDMSPEDAGRYLEEMNEFYIAGWTRIMGQ